MGWLDIILTNRLTIPEQNEHRQVKHHGFSVRCIKNFNDPLYEN